MITGVSRAAAAVLAASVAIAGCQAEPAAHVMLENDTDIPLAVHVNGGWLGTYPAGAVAEVPIRLAPPYRIEARSDSGAVLSALEVTTDDAQRVLAGARSLRATSDTPCGMIRLTFGDVAAEPMPAPKSAPGPCP